MCHHAQVYVVLQFIDKDVKGVIFHFIEGFEKFPKSTSEEYLDVWIVTDGCDTPYSFKESFFNRDPTLF